MKRTLLILALMLLVAPAVLAADPAPAATAQICTGVKDRAPVGAADKFPATVGELYCFSVVTNATDKIVQVWFHGDKEVCKVELPVKAARWRTWSTKKILPGMTGAWRVEVHDAAGGMLATANFTVE
jgi:hypothetical protein